MDKESDVSCSELKDDYRLARIYKEWWVRCVKGVTICGVWEDQNLNAVTQWSQRSVVTTSCDVTGDTMLEPENLTFLEWVLSVQMDITPLSSRY